MFFVGVDLAWSDKNDTGIAIIKGQKNNAHLVCCSVETYNNLEIASYIVSHTKGKPALIAIDASLIVNNNTGERKVETELKRMFARYHAVPYPSNRNLFYRLYGDVRGEKIARILEEKGYRHDPYIKKFEENKKFFEVFPHSAMVVIFELEGILKYKARKNRPYHQRWQEFSKYQSYLKNLESRKPSLILPHYITNIDVNNLKGKSLKQYEDLLDAVFCTYIAFYYWYAPEKCSVIGNLNEGYIVTPTFHIFPG